MEPLKRLGDQVVGEVDRCYFQDLENGFDGACACECHGPCGWMSQRAKHNGTVTAMIVVSLVTPGIMKS